MLPPFVYPLYGIIYLIKRPDLLLHVLGTFCLYGIVALLPHKCTASTSAQRLWASSQDSQLWRYWCLSSGSPTVLSINITTKCASVHSLAYDFACTLPADCRHSSADWAILHRYLIASLPVSMVVPKSGP